MEKEEAGTRIEQLDQKLKVLQERKHALVQIRENWDALSERVYTSERLEQIDDFPFPEKGLHRLDECKREIRKVEAQIETLQHKRDIFLERLEGDPIVGEGEEASWKRRWHHRRVSKNGSMILRITEGKSRRLKAGSAKSGGSSP
ncbi:hypothetical protein ACPJHQ_09350 [Rossellomorea sp. H39__3]